MKLENDKQINELLWMVKDIVLNQLKFKVKQDLSANEIFINAFSSNKNLNNAEENPALILITYEVVRRLIRDEFIEATEIQGKYKITQNYYDYLKINVDK